MLKIHKIVFVGGVISMILLGAVLSNPQLFSKDSTTEFRNLSFDGKVIDRYINEEKKEKTHTIVLSDSTKYRLPRLDIDKEIEIGDSVVKVKWTYEITIYKGGNLGNKIIYALPFTE